MTGAAPGLQVERTSLAWGRSVLSVLALGLLLVRTGVTATQPLEVAAGLVSVVLAATLAVVRDLRLLGLALPVLCALTLAALLRAG